MSANVDPRNENRPDEDASPNAVAVAAGREIHRAFLPWLAVLLLISACPGSVADTIDLADGGTLCGVYLRDEGTRLLVWDSLDEVGGPAKSYPRSAVKGYRIERPAEWDTRPPLPDLSVTFIEMTPKLAGLHGVVDYDRWGRPSPRPGGVLKAIGDRAFLHPGEMVEGVKLRYRDGEPITLSAHVKNVGFASAKPFDYAFLIDETVVRKGRFDRRLAEMEEAAFALKWRWQEGFHHVTFRISPTGREIATVNDQATDPLWGWGLTFITHPKRAAAWHENRTAFGTFSFEDFYRWHVEIMNRLFADSVYPSAPDGIRARVRLDRIVYADDVEKAAAEGAESDGLRHDQGRWIWIDEMDRTGEWKPPARDWRNQTEWSLPHELGHQLGLTDYYALDYEGTANHIWPDNGKPVQHFMTQPRVMMHWHGPHLWSEATAGYLNATWDRPRGHFGDYYFAIPREIDLRLLDVNSVGVPNATVEIFQRGTVVDPDGKSGTDRGTMYHPVVEDGDFDHPVSKKPVITGETDAEGIFHLPNRPAMEVRTLNGFLRTANPFGNLNVVGQRGLMLVRVTKRSSPPAFYWLEIHPIVVAWFRGNRDRLTIPLRTPFGSIDSPAPPRSVSAATIDENRVRVTWTPPAVRQEQQFLSIPTGYRVYRRVSNEGLDDHPWFPVATLGPDAREAIVDLRGGPESLSYYSSESRFAVTTIGPHGVESEMVSVLPTPRGE